MGKRKGRHVSKAEKNIVNNLPPIITNLAYLLDLSYDILHSLLEEWLEWRDIIHMDHACLGSCRPVWLSILAGIRFPLLFNQGGIDKMLFSTYYRWCQLRHVISRSIAFDLIKFDDLLWLVDEGLCDQIQALLIICEQETEELKRQQLLLADFLDHCIHLKRLHFMADTSLLKVIASHVSGLTFIELSNMLLEEEDIVPFLSKYQSTLKQLSIGEGHDNNLHTMLTMVHSSCLTLQELKLRVGDNSLHSNAKDLFISYLTSFGMKLEVLSLSNFCQSELRVTKDLIESIFSLCPSLSSLELISIPNDENDDDDEEEEAISFDFLSEIFHSYPKLKFYHALDVSIDVQLHGKEPVVYFRNNSWSQFPQESIFFLQHQFVKKSYLVAVLVPHCRLGEDMIHLIIDELGPHLIAFSCCCPSITDDLVDDMMDGCYNLVALSICNENYVCHLSDDALHSICYAKELVVLSLSFGSSSLFSDKTISELITVCKGLSRVTLPSAGVASLKAVQKHPSLEEFTFTFVDEDHVEDMERFLHDKRYRWPEKLSSGEIVFENGSTLRFFEQKEYVDTHSFTILKKKSNQPLYIVRGEEE